MCVMDVLDEVGDDVARRCYWDFGDWSDLWRETKHVPSGVNLQVSTYVGAVCTHICCCKQLADHHTQDPSGG